METSDFVPGGELHLRKHKNKMKEDIALNTMKAPISAKERTKSKFDQLVKAALEEAKLKPTLNKSKAIKVPVNNDAEQETEFKTSENIKLTKRKKKKKRKDDKQGLLNPVYEDDPLFTKEPAHFFPNKGNNLLLNDENDDDNWKQLKQERNAKSSTIIETEEFSLEKPKKIPRTKHKKAKVVSNGDNTVNDVYPDCDRSSPEKNNKPKHLKNGETEFIAGIGNELRNSALHHVIQAEVYNVGGGSSSRLETGSDSMESTPSKSSKRENRRRHKQLLEKKEEAPTESLRESSSSSLEPVAHGIDVPPIVSDGEAIESAASNERVTCVEEESLENSSILGITIHRVDRLKMNYKIKHPLVRVHIVDSNTGTYVKNSSKEKLVTTVHENQNSNVDFIMSVITQPCELKLNKFFSPIWEETLIFNENFDYFTRNDSNVIVFFELLDFLPMSLVTSKHSKYGQDGGWYRIAWAFLKIVGANNTLNTGRKIKLQLYCTPKQRLRPKPRILDVYHWWSQLPKIPYPCAMYVTLNSLSPPKNLSPTLRSMAPMQEERGKMTIDWSDRGSATDGVQVVDGSPRKSIISPATLQWNRLPGQACKVPNKQILSLTTDKNGCFAAKFSYNGKFIACGCQSDTVSHIMIYEIPSGALMSRLRGHAGLIYDLNWSKTDCFLLSASADGTARIWSCSESNTGACHMLPHPSFVYCADYHPEVQSVVVTGCYDNLVRVWSVKQSERNPQLVQELESHRGHVNTICFDFNGDKLFSGDSLGVVCVWAVDATRHSNIKQGSSSHWMLCHEIKEPLLRGVSINMVIHHPSLHRVIIQARDSSLRMMDYQKMQFVQCYKGFLNLCEHLRGCISPCGNLVFAGSEDGTVYGWNCITGDIVATYSSLPYRQTVHCVQFHPHDHIIAFCYHGNKNSVIIYRYDFQFAPLHVNQVQPLDGNKGQTTSGQMLTSTPQSHFGKRTVTFNMTNEDSLPPLGRGGTSALEKIMQKLDSVLETPIFRSQRPSLGLDSSSKSMNASSIADSTIFSWDTTFESTLCSNYDAVAENSRAVAQYDYIAQRSDELTFKNGETINIVKIESDQWLVGRLNDGKQGYVPANYVVIINNNENRSNSKSSDVTAVLTKSGHLTFISDSDDEREEAPVKKF